MKIKVEIECSPQEAREFFGLPDMKPMQTRFLEEVSEKWSEVAPNLKADDLMRIWSPQSMENLDQVQKAFWSFAQKAMGSQKRQDD